MPQDDESIRRNAKMDQATAFLTEHLPVLWRAMYQRNLEEGWPPAEAFDLVKTYILSQCPNGVNAKNQ
jgi:hypothetical protein